MGWSRPFVEPSDETSEGFSLPARWESLDFNKTSRQHPSKNRTCARPHCNATPSEHFLHTSHGTLHTLHFTLHNCTSQSTLHLIWNNLSYSHLMSPHLSSSHLIPSLLTCHPSKFFSTVFISSEHWKQFISTHLSSSAWKKALTVRAKSLAQKK